MFLDIKESKHIVVDQDIVDYKETIEIEILTKNQLN